MLDLTMLAFDLAFKYRNPVVILGDGYLGQMTGKVELPDDDAEAGPARVGGLGRQGPPPQPDLLDLPGGDATSRPTTCISTTSTPR